MICTAVESTKYHTNAMSRRCFFREVAERDAQINEQHGRKGAQHKPQQTLEYIGDCGRVKEKKKCRRIYAVR